MDLKDKKVIITGGVKGIGHSLVTKMICEGAVVGVVDKDKNTAENISKRYDIKAFSSYKEIIHEK